MNIHAERLCRGGGILMGIAGTLLAIGYGISCYPRVGLPLLVVTVLGLIAYAIGESTETMYLEEDEFDGD